MKAEELTKLARESKAPAEEKSLTNLQKKRLSQIRRFISAFEISSGEEKVPTYVVFREFKRWAHQHCLGTIGKSEFFRLFGKSFTSGRNGKFRYYLLKPGKVDNSKKAREEARKFDKECKSGV